VLVVLIVAIVGGSCVETGPSGPTDAAPLPERSAPPEVNASIAAPTPTDTGMPMVVSLRDALELQDGTQVHIAAPLFWHGDGRVSICGSIPGGEPPWCGAPAVAVFESHLEAVAAGVSRPVGASDVDHRIGQVALVVGTIDGGRLVLESVTPVPAGSYPDTWPMSTTAASVLPVGTEVVVLGNLAERVDDGTIRLCAGLGESWPPSCGGPPLVLTGAEPSMRGASSCCDPESPMVRWIDEPVSVRGRLTEAGIDVELVVVHQPADGSRPGHVDALSRVG